MSQNAIENTQKSLIGAGFLFALCFLVSRPNLLALYEWLNLPQSNWRFAAQMVFICVAFVVLYPLLTKQTLASIGLRPFNSWNKNERHFLVIGVLVSNGCFLLLTSKWRRLLAFDDQILVIALVVVPMLCWGFFQEMVYRGLLQKTLSEKLGDTQGILISNLVFTFGTVHFHHYQYIAENLWHLKYFAFIFAAGLFFAWIYKRYNNLWLAGLFHGIGNVYLDSSNVAKALF